MKKKIALLLNTILICGCLAGCGATSNKHDVVCIYNKDAMVFDDITLTTPYGYFYKEHEKFTVDDNTIAVTIYFSSSEEDSWD